MRVSGHRPSLSSCIGWFASPTASPMNKSTRLLAIEAENRKFLRADTRRIRRDWAPWRWIGRPCGRWHSPPRTCWGKSTRSPRESLAGRAQRRVGWRGHVVERQYAQRPFWRLFALGGSGRPHCGPGGCHAPQTAAFMHSNVAKDRACGPRPKHRGVLSLL